MIPSKSYTSTESHSSKRRSLEPIPPPSHEERFTKVFHTLHFEARSDRRFRSVRSETQRIQYLPSLNQGGLVRDECHDVVESRALYHAGRLARLRVTLSDSEMLKALRSESDEAYSESE
jgi:hypothetical protein